MPLTMESKKKKALRNTAARDSGDGNCTITKCVGHDCGNPDLHQSRLARRQPEMLPSVAIGIGTSKEFNYESESPSGLHHGPYQFPVSSRARRRTQWQRARLVGIRHS